jgi:glycosyltransferase involved in cell wall biosynthesis
VKKSGANEAYMGQPRVGVLCYSLMPATVDLLNRLNALGQFSIKGFPLVRTAIEVQANFPYRLPRFRGRHVHLNNLAGSAPDTQLLTLSLPTVNALVKESDVILLMGLQALPALYATWLARRQSKPVIAVSQTMGAASERNRLWLIRLLKRWILKRATLHVVQTPPTIETLTSVYGISENLFIHAPFEAGVSFYRQLYDREKQTREDFREQFNAGGEVIVLFVGSLLALKGIDVLLEAFARIYKSAPAKLWIVGDGPEGANLKRKALELGVDEVTLFWGRQSPEALVGLYKAADVFVLPSRKDVWPKVLAEAALASLPLICTEKCGAASHLVQDGVNGFVVPAGDAGALAKGIKQLFDANLRHTFGDKSRNSVNQFFDPAQETAGFAASIRLALER